MFAVLNRFFRKFEVLFLNIKNKLLATLLIFLFVVSIGVVVAEDTADVSEELAVDDVDEDVEVDENADDAAVADDEAPTTGAAPDVGATGDADENAEDLTSLAINVEILDKNIKAGDEFRVKITVENFGENPAENVVAGFSFTDLADNPDSSVQLVDDGGYAVTAADGGFFVDYGFLDAGDYEEVILTFLASQSGEKMIYAAVTADNVIMEPTNYFETTFTVGENSNAAGNTKAGNADKVSSAKTASTGNPLALLGLALCGLVPYYRRD